MTILFWTLGIIGWLSCGFIANILFASDWKMRFGRDNESGSMGFVGFLGGPCSLLAAFISCDKLCYRRNNFITDNIANKIYDRYRK